MIKGVVIKNYLDEKMTIEMGNPQKTGIYIKNIDGLGLPSTSVQTDEIVNYNISNYMSSSVSPRNLVFTFGITDDEYVEMTRRKLYKYFIAQFPTQLEIVTDVIGSVSIVGYVESFDPDIFSNAETVQISLICPDPYFYTGGKITESSDNKTGLFNFTSWYEENAKKYVNTPSVSKPVSLLEEKNGDGEHPIDISYMSRVFNPKGFELEVYQDENTFQKIEIDYLTGSITLNPGIIDPKLESNQFNNCSLLIKNGPDDQNVYKKDKLTGDLTSLLDLCLIEGDFPNLVPGKNYFRAKIYGLYISDKPYYDFFIQDLYNLNKGNKILIRKNQYTQYPYPSSYDAGTSTTPAGMFGYVFEITRPGNVYGGPLDRYEDDIRWGEIYKSEPMWNSTDHSYSNIRSYREFTIYYHKLNVYKKIQSAPDSSNVSYKFMGTLTISSEDCVLNKYAASGEYPNKKLTFESSVSWGASEWYDSIEINGKDQNTSFSILQSYSKIITDDFNNRIRQTSYPVGLCMFVYILNKDYSDVSDGRLFPPNVSSVRVPSSNVFHANENDYIIEATVLEDVYWEKSDGSIGSRFIRYTRHKGDLPLTVKISDLNVPIDEFIEFLFAELGDAKVNADSSGNWLIGNAYGSSEYYGRVFRKNNPGIYDETIQVIRETYDGKINISYDERYDAI